MAVTIDVTDPLCLHSRSARRRHRCIEGDEQAISTASSNQVDPAIALGDDGGLVIWQDSRNGFIQTYGARLTSSLSIVDAEGIELSDGGLWRDPPVVAGMSKPYTVAWTRRDTENDRIHLMERAVGDDVAPAQSVVSAPVANGSPLNSNMHPAIAITAEGALLTWQSVWDVEPTIFGGRVAAGHLTPPEGRVLSTQHSMSAP